VRCKSFIGRGQWTITLTRRSGLGLPTDERPATGREPGGEEAPPPAPSPLAAELTARGVTSATAVERAAAFPDDEVRARVEAFDWLTARRDRLVSRNPGGYLVESIRKRYAPPKGFECVADRARRLDAEAELRRKVEAARLQAEVDQHARREAEQVRVRAYLDALSPANLDRLEADALAEPGMSFLAQQYRRGASDPERAGRYRRMILDAHVLTLLDRAAERPDGAD
jgi:hypothetical protein